MKVKKYKRGLAVMLGLALAVQLPGAVPFHPMDTYAYTGAATVKASSLNVRSGAGTGYRAIGRLAAGASIQVLGEQRVGLDEGPGDSAAVRDFPVKCADITNGYGLSISKCIADCHNLLPYLYVVGVPQGRHLNLAHGIGGDIL